jgi:hypothetical protein
MRWPWPDSARSVTKKRVKRVAPRAPEDVDWEGLSPRGQAILRVVAMPLAAGYSHQEVAELLGRPERVIGALLKELQDELGTL